MQPSIRLTIGMDVGDRYSHLVVLDESGQVIRRDRIATTAAEIQRWFVPYAGQRVVLEVGPHSLWISRLLKDLYDLIIANPAKVALIHGSDDKQDRVDAEKLARLGRADPALLHPIQHRRPETQAALAFIRSRDTLVRSRTMLINCVRGTAKAAGVMLPKGTAATFHTRTDALPELVADALVPLMESIEAITKQIRHYDQVIADMAREVYPETQALLEVPGVGPLTALCFVLTLEDPERFPSGAKVAGYLGLRPRRGQTGNSDPELSITKAGDPLLRRLLVQCAHRLVLPIGTPCALRDWAQKLAARGGKAARKRAVIAVARKLAVTLHALWKSGATYQPYPARAAA